MLLSGCGLLSGPAPVPPSVGPSVAVPAGLERFYAQRADWHDCGGPTCARIEVPVDYTHPDGPTISLSMTRIAASGDGALGTLFINPGGPGGSATDYARVAKGVIDDSVREAYDVVGVDPRGVGGSDPIHCLTDAQNDSMAATPSDPRTPQEKQALLDALATPAKGCADQALVAHLSTQDAARDLDIARASVGSDTFNYLGKSYGTMLGITYAQLFPSRVGRMVLDGVLPPDLDLIDVTKGQADAFELALAHFVADCVTHSDCPLSGTSDQALAQLRTWLASLRDHPLPGKDRDLNQALATYAVLTQLYFPPDDWSTLRIAVSAAMKDGNPQPLFEALDARINRNAQGHYTDNGNDAFYAVTCLDRPYAGSVDETAALAEQWKKDDPTFGEGLAWGLLACANWPAKADRITTVDARTANPILVVTSLYDPATPGDWGLHLGRVIPSGAVITRQGDGHTGYRRGSACIDDAVDAYLVTGTTPGLNATCTD